MKCEKWKEYVELIGDVNRLPYIVLEGKGTYVKYTDVLNLIESKIQTNEVNDENVGRKTSR